MGEVLPHQRTFCFELFLSNRRIEMKKDIRQDLFAQGFGLEKSSADKCAAWALGGPAGIEQIAQQRISQLKSY